MGFDYHVSQLCKRALQEPNALTNIGPFIDVNKIA